MSVHEAAAPYSGDPAKAIEVAKIALLGHGFVVSNVSSRALEASGPGMRNTAQPPLAGVSEIAISVEPSRVVARANLGAARRMKLFVWIFPPALVVLLSLGFLGAGMRAGWVPALAVAPWIVIAPLFGRSIERRTRAAVDGLVRSMAAV